MALLLRPNGAGWREPGKGGNQRGDARRFLPMRRMPQSRQDFQPSIGQGSQQPLLVIHPEQRVGLTANQQRRRVDLRQKVARRAELPAAKIAGIAHVGQCLFACFPSVADIAAEPGVRNVLPSAVKHGPIKPGCAFMAHLPVKGQVGQLVDTWALPKALTVIGMAAFGQVCPPARLAASRLVEQG